MLLGSRRWVSRVGVSAAQARTRRVTPRFNSAGVPPQQGSESQIIDICLFSSLMSRPFSVTIHAEQTDHRFIRKKWFHLLFGFFQHATFCYKENGFLSPL